MALGEWRSALNAREVASTQSAKKHEEIEPMPQVEQHELATHLTGVTHRRRHLIMSASTGNATSTSSRE
jgi:hypothetical protein